MYFDWNQGGINIREKGCEYLAKFSAESIDFIYNFISTDCIKSLFLEKFLMGTLGLKYLKDKKKTQTRKKLRQIFIDW